MNSIIVKVNNYLKTDLYNVDDELYIQVNTCWWYILSITTHFN